MTLAKMLEEYWEFHKAFKCTPIEIIRKLQAQNKVMHKALKHYVVMDDFLGLEDKEAKEALAKCQEIENE